MDLDALVSLSAMSVMLFAVVELSSWLIVLCLSIAGGRVKAHQLPAASRQTATSVITHRRFHFLSVRFRIDISSLCHPNMFEIHSRCLAFLHEIILVIHCTNFTQSVLGSQTPPFLREIIKRRSCSLEISILS